MWRKLRRIAFPCAVILAVLPARGFSLHTDPGRVEVGDTGTFYIPVENFNGSNKVITNERVSLSGVPVWMDIESTSILGPADIYPGETVTFEVNFVINSAYELAASSAEIAITLASDSPSFVPARLTWHFNTANGFKTSRGQSADNTGFPYDQYVSPDVAAPTTYLNYDGPLFEDAAGHIFISTQTSVYFEGSDSYVANTEISGVKLTGHEVGSVPASFDGLAFSTKPVQLAEGPRTLYYASQDNAGNTEVIKSSAVVVDGTAPAPPVGLKADGTVPSPWKNVRQFSLTWTDPADVSGIAGVRVKYGADPPSSNRKGDFYPAGGSLVYSSTDIADGENIVWLWLEDNVGNADPVTASSITLRYDGEHPVSSLSAPALSSASIVRLDFVSSDAISGIEKTVLWSRLDGAAWSSGTYVMQGNSGVFSFDTAGRNGYWEFYTQSFDKAGNRGSVPVSTAATTTIYVDATPPVISKVRVTEIAYNSARVSWETDDAAACRVEYGLREPYDKSVNTPGGGTLHSLYLAGLLYPADYTFRISAVNRTGLRSVFSAGAFYVPPKMTAAGDSGVLPAGQPIVIEVSNPYVSSISYTLNGQTVMQTVSSGTPIEIYPSPGSGQMALSLNLQGFTYSTSFVVDTATRSVRLARLVIADGGLISAPQSGQSAVEVTAGQAAQLEMTTGSYRLYLGYYAGIDPVPPGKVTGLRGSSGPAGDQAILTWPAPGDDADKGTAMRYDIRWSTFSMRGMADFDRAAKAADIPFPLTAGTTQTAVVAGLNQLTTYYFAVLSEDEVGSKSELSNVAALFKGYVAAGTITVNGVSEISFVSPVAPSIALISTVSPTGAVAIGSAAASGLALAGNMYEIGPEGTYDPPALLTFHYSTTTLAELGMRETEVAVYEHFTAQGWVKLPGQVLDVAGHAITVSITRISSLFGIFGHAKDRAAPVTEIAYSGSQYRADGKVYISAGSSVALTAYDPVVYATSTGVAFIEYRIDPGTASAFIAYGAPFSMSGGVHGIEFRSADKAGNIETTRLNEVHVDTAAPLTEAWIAGTAGQGGWNVSAATVSFVSTDTLSGVSKLYYRIGASTETLEYSGPVFISSEGVAGLHYFSSDNVGNIEAEESSLLKIDLSAPQVYAVSSPTANAYGWNNGPVAVVFSGTDAVSGLAYCSSSATITSEGAGRPIPGACYDNAGLSSTAAVVVNIDTTPPTIQYNRAPAANEYGWNSSTVTIKFACADILSGVRACPADIPLASEGAGISTSAVVLDFAGNSSSVAVAGIRIDKGAPLSGTAVVGALKNGWYSSPVTVTVTSTDVLSGVLQVMYAADNAAFAAYQEPVSVMADGAHAIKYYAMDKAGNTEPEKSISFAIDRTAPQVSNVVSPPPNASGWNNGALTVLYVGTDTLSGVDICPARGIASEGAGQNVAGWCRDRAGNVGYSTAVVNVDISSPVVRAVQIPAANEAGWNNSAVTVAFTGDDAVSGVAGCSPDRTVSVEGAAQAVTGSCVDRAGNTGYYTRTLYIDKTAPQSSATLSGVMSNGWYNSGVGITLVSSDALSGVAQTYYRLERDGVLVSSGNSSALVPVVEDGRYSLYYHAVDKAGNAETERSAAFRIDRSPPQVAYTPAPPPNSAGWNNTAVQVVFSGTDTLSGLAECSSATLTTEGAAQAVSGWCRDLAGNIAYATATISIDVSSPAVTISSPPAGRVFVATRGKINIAFGVTDNLDPAPVFSAFLEQLADKGSPRGARPARITVVNGQALEPLDIDDGIWRLAVSATDFAGNSAAVAGGTFEVVHDVLPPRTALAVSDGPLYESAGNQYIRKETVLKLTSADDLVQAGDGAGLGVKSQSTSVAGRAWAFVNPDPRQGGVYISTLALDGQADGVYYLRYSALDVLGNAEAVKVSTLTVDNTAPEAAAQLDGIAGENGWHVSTVTVSLSAVDALSGVAGIFYRLDGADGAAFARYAGSFAVAAEGRHTVLFYAADNLGNTSAQQSRSFKIDRTAPVVTKTITPEPNPDGWHNGAVTVSFAGSDAVSGIAYCDPARTTRVEGRDIEVSGSCRDYAGLSGTVTARLSVDLTSPTINAERSPLANAYGWNNTDVTAKFICSDALSGIRSCPAPKVFGAEGARQGITGAAEDHADNTSSASISGINIDKTAPETALSVGGDIWQDAGKNYLSLRSRVTLSAADPLSGGAASGVEAIEYSLDSGQFQVYSSSFSLAEGARAVGFRARDKAGNTGVTKTSDVYVDGTPPQTTHHIGWPYYAAGGVNYITPATPLTFTAADPVASAVASGVKRIEVAVDGGAFGDYTAALTLPEGRHTIRYRAIDNVGNTEAEKTLEVQSDNTPSVSAWLASSGETITLGGMFYLNVLGSIALQSEDPAAAGVASGVEGIYYGIDAAPASRYAAPFGLAEGIRSVSFYAKDNVGNAEVVKSTVIYVDGTAPESALSASGDQYHGGRVYISTRSLVLITAQDPVAAGVASGVRETKCSVDGGAFSAYSAFGLPVEGKRVVAYYSTDQVGNVEAVKTAELWVDATPPATAFSIDGARHDVDGLIYITKDSGVVLAPADPVSAGTASGVMLTKYRVDGGNWQIYSGSFTIIAEGRHTLEYYSLDRVQNAEALKSAALVVDNTPPASAVSLGEPKFTVFGLPVLSPDTPITLAATDAVSAGVASGLRQIYYEVVNVASGVSSRYSYVEPFRLPQGTWDLRYWSADNVANAEAYKQIRFAVSTFQNDSLQAADGLDLSGTADIAGAVRSNAVVSVSGNARILGDVTASTITLVGKAQITGQQISGATPLSPEPVYLGAIPDIPVSTVPAGYLIAGRLVVNSQAKLTLSTGTYRFNGIELAGGSEISVNGKVEILVSGDVSIGGGSSLNAAGLASDLNIFVNSASTLSFTGGGNLVAKVYAPKAHLKLVGSAVLGGHYFARTAAVSGTGNILQAGETLPKTSAAAVDGGTGKKKASAFAAESYSVLSGPDPAFRLGEIYVFPNPAKGGEAPVFHVETGIADSVKITVYTVSGRQAHETSLIGMPAALDDGNGLSYAYEYTWRGYIPSGVYYYHIEAEKFGQKLKKSGKFAVVR